MIVSDYDVKRIAAESLCDYRTVRRAYEGGAITGASRERIRRAAEALGLTPPPPTTYRLRVLS